MISSCKYIFISCLLLLSNLAYAQFQDKDSTHITESIDESSPPYIRVGLGLGKSSLRIGAIVFVEYDLGNMFFSLRTTGASTFDFSNSNTDIADYALLGGLPFNFKWGYLSLGAGVSVVKYPEKRPNNGPTGIAKLDGYNTINSYSIGLPLQLDLFLTPARFFGLGLVIFWDVNKFKTYNGIAVCIEIGWLR